ncbi:MAG: right-handed parallel beta-helix repeat-containing protein [Candidatus Acetothermia bacterium]|jgi:nitrous oxidase accessory protein NosD|nr:right-handed parallel beta-helix repeat-containing protein [Candidatus Acetothermia bacterium]MDH7505870.1 right-handed parallel beta-helix repeat-containing protein [Candidatus Acetothermia bacterium]
MGIDVVAVTDIVIKHNYVSEDGGLGIGVHNSLKSEVSYNQLWNNGSGIVLDFVAQSNVAHNEIKGNNGGISIRGLRLDRGEKQISLQYNKLQNNVQWGIRILDIPAGGKAEIYRNEILTSGWGVWLLNAEAMTTMEQNTLEGNEHGVVVDRSRVMLKENRIVKNEGWGVVLSKDTLRIPGGGTLWCLSGEVDWTKWAVRGADNEIHGNGQGDLCPEDYPWPPGFVKGP